MKDTADPKKKQPYFIKLRDERTMFFAALGQVRLRLEPGERDGFEITRLTATKGWSTLITAVPSY
ncbi:hypothetical protein ACP3TY_05560 [Pseudomonas rustica]|uniref:hypothetical protein n=1 Tax=Pseudomonas rustica TaxID=2827099 RepID=UPI003CF015B2